jgi:hypothetical protein
VLVFIDTMMIRNSLFDRGREDRLSSIPPPSEPDRRISRIRLSSWWFTLSRIDMPVEGSGQDPIPANGTENLRDWSPVALMTKAVNMYRVCAASSCHALTPWLSPICLALGLGTRIGLPSVSHTSIHPPPCTPLLQVHYGPFLAPMGALTPARPALRLFRE